MSAPNGGDGSGTRDVADARPASRAGSPSDITHVAPIVVGVSPTTGSIAAVEWALDYARRVKAPLLAVAAWQVPRGATPPAVAPHQQAEAVENLALEAGRALAKTVTAIAGETSSVTQYVERGATSAVLLRAAEDAQLLVIGSPHPGELGRLRPSLLAPQLLYRAKCPVVVMPEATYGPTGSWLKSAANRLVEAAGTAGRPGLGVRLPPPSGSAPRVADDGVDES